VAAPFLAAAATMGNEKVVLMASSSRKLLWKRRRRRRKKNWLWKQIDYVTYEISFSPKMGNLWGVMVFFLLLFQKGSSPVVHPLHHRLRDPVGPRGTLWDPVEPRGPLWTHVDPCGPPPWNLSTSLLKHFRSSHHYLLTIWAFTPTGNSFINPCP